MPLYIYEQCKRNTIKVLKCLQTTLQKSWSWIDKKSTRISRGFQKQIVGRINRKVHKHKKCLRILCVILFILAIIAALFMLAFKSAGSRQQGLQINYTQQVLKQQYYTNDWKYTGLNGYMEVIPKQKILIQFRNNQTPPEDQQITHQVYSSIEARVSEGTKLMIESRLECSIIIADKNIKGFYENYGFDQTPDRKGELQWMTYLREKITNTIVQAISAQSFYSITTKSLKQSINTKFSQLFTTFPTTFPFSISILTLTINYPQNSFPINNTLGVQLLRAKSILNQLENQFSTLKSYTTNNKAEINATYMKNVLIRYKERRFYSQQLTEDQWEFTLMISGSMGQIKWAKC